MKIPSQLPRYAHTTALLCITALLNAYCVRALRTDATRTLSSLEHRKA
jgi:hypothetical protein